MKSTFPVAVAFIGALFLAFWVISAGIHSLPIHNLLP